MYTVSYVCRIAPTLLRLICAPALLLLQSYCCFSNQGGVVHPKTTIEDLDELSSLLQVGGDLEISITQKKGYAEVRG